MRTKLKPLHVFVPFETIERRDSDGAYIVEGYAFCNEVVGGEGGVRLKRSAMEAATPDYLKFGAIREMHQPIAAGTCLEATWDERGCRLRAEIVDEAAIKKIERKVYKGFSVGVNPKDVSEDRVVSRCEWPETSLVDRPKDPDALFLHRAEMLDPDAEVEVEVIEDAPAAAADDAAAAPDRVQSLPIADPSSSPLPSGEEAPPSAALQSAQAPAEGVSSSPEEPVDLAVMRAALVRSGTPEEMLDQLDVAASYQALTPEQRADGAEPVERYSLRRLRDGRLAIHDATTNELLTKLFDGRVKLCFDTPEKAEAYLVERRAADVQTTSNPEWLTVEGQRAAQAAENRWATFEAPSVEQRAQTTQTVPIRENLDGMPKPPPEQKPQIAPRPLPVPPAHPAPGTGYPPPATGVPPIPPGMMPKRMRAEEIAEELRAMLEQANALKKELDGEPIERVIKHEDGKWCVYSESGKKLGEHDTEEEAKKQLQAIEIEKHKDEEGATQPKKDRAAEAEVERYEIVDAPGLFQANMPAFVLLDNQEHVVVRWASTREDVEAHLAQLTVPAVEDPPAAPETISRSSERDDVTAALTRAATAEAELARVRSGHEEALQRLAAAEARVQTLERMPAKPIFRSLPPPEARVREFLQNLGRDEDVELERMKAAYPDAKAAAEAEARASDGRDGVAYVRWMTLRAQLAELGVKYD